MEEDTVPKISFLFKATQVWEEDTSSPRAPPFLRSCMWYVWGEERDGSSPNLFSYLMVCSHTWLHNNRHSLSCYNITDNSIKLVHLECIWLHFDFWFLLSTKYFLFFWFLLQNKSKKAKSMFGNYPPLLIKWRKWRSQKSPLNGTNIFYPKKPSWSIVSNCTLPSISAVHPMEHRPPILVPPIHRRPPC